MRGKSANSNLLCAFAAFISVWVLALLCGIGWDTNDDCGIAYLISQTSSGGTVFQHKLLVYFLHFLYNVAPGVNHWLVFSLFAVSAGFGASVYVFSKSHSGPVMVLVPAALLVLIKCFVLNSMNFSRTAAVALSGGIMMMADTTDNKTLTDKLLQAVIGFLILIFGASIRPEFTWPAIAFALVFSFSTQIIYKNARNTKKTVLVCVLLACFVFTNGLLLSEEEKEYLEYNHNRSLFSDYLKEMPAFDDEDGIYEEQGLSQSDYDLLTSWTTEDTEVFSPEVLSKLAPTKRVSYNLGLLMFKTRWALYDTFQYRNVYYLLATAAAAAIFAVVGGEKWKNCFPSACLIACFGILFVYLCWSGRVVDRVTFGLIWMLISSLLLLPVKQSEIRNRVYPAVLLSFSLIWSALILCCGQIKSVPWRNDVYNEQLRKEIYDVINEDRSNIYIFPMTGIKPKSEVFDDWHGYPKGYCDNLFYLGGWSARCPYNIEKLNDYGITNPMRALFENDNVYSCRGWKTEEILEFIRRHYDKGAKIESAGTIGNLDIIRYTGGKK